MVAAPCLVCRFLVAFSSRRSTCPTALVVRAYCDRGDGGADRRGRRRPWRGPDPQPHDFAVTGPVQASGPGRDDHRPPKAPASGVGVDPADRRLDEHAAQHDRGGHRPQQHADLGPGHQPRRQGRGRHARRRIRSPGSRRAARPVVALHGHGRRREPDRRPPIQQISQFTTLAPKVVLQPRDLPDRRRHRRGRHAHPDPLQHGGRQQGRRHRRHACDRVDTGDRRLALVQ